MRSSLLKGNRTKAMAILLALTLTLMFAMPVMAADAQTGVIQTVIIEVDQNTLVEVNIADYAEACALKNALYNYLKGANEAPKVVALKGDNKRVDLLAYATNYAEQGNNVAAALAQSPELSADTLAKVNELISFNPETGVPELKPIVEPETKLVVESVSATNGTITLTMTGEGTPVESEFSFGYKINSVGSKPFPEVPGLGNFDWNEATKTVTFAFTPFEPTNEAQSIEICWQYVGNEKGGWADAFIVPAQEGLAVSSVSAINNTGASVALDGATNILGDKERGIKVTFNEEVNADTVTTANIKLYKGATGTVLAPLANPTLNSAKTEATIKPVSALADNTTYRLVLGADIANKAGDKKLTEKVITFTTGETAYPVIGATTFAGAAANADFKLGEVVNSTAAAGSGTIIEVEFNKDLLGTSVSNQSVKLYNVTDSKYVANPVAVKAATTKTIQLTSSVNAIEANKKYRLEVSASVLDFTGAAVVPTNFEFTTYAGVGVAATFAKSDYDFVTGLTGLVWPKLTAGTLDQDSPAPNQPVKFYVKLTSNVAIDEATINATNIKLEKWDTTNDVALATVETTLKYDATFKTVEIVPTADLADGADYKLTVVKNGVADIYGNKIAADASAAFKTFDLTPPTVTKVQHREAAQNFADVASGVANIDQTKANSFKFVFNEKVGVIDYRDSGNGATNAADAATTHIVANAATDITAGDAIMLWDYAANPAQAIGTGVVAATSADKKEVTITVNAGVLGQNKTYAIYLAGKNGLPAGSPTTAVAGGDNNVKVFVDTRDDNTNHNRMTDTYLFTFSTKAADTVAPKVESVKTGTTYAAATAFPEVLYDAKATTKVFFTFDEKVNFAAGSSPVSIYDVDANGDWGVDASKGGISIDTAETGKILVVDLGAIKKADSSSLAPDTRYRVRVTTDVTDLANNPLAAQSAPYTFVTATGTTVSKIQGTNTSDAVVDLPQNNIKKDSQFLVTFSAAYDANTINSDTVFIQDSQGNKVAAALTMPASDTVNIKPDANLTEGETYTVKVSGVKNAKGNTIPEFIKTMIIADTSKPKVSTFAPINGATNIAVDSSATITFNKAMDPTTITAANMGISTADVANSVYAVVTYNAETMTASIKPDSYLAAGTTYNIVINETAIKAANGKAIGTTTNKALGFFTTSPIAKAPKVLSATLYKGAVTHTLQIVLETPTKATVATDNTSLTWGSTTYDGTATYPGASATKVIELTAITDADALKITSGVSTVSVNPSAAGVKQLVDANGVLFDTTPVKITKVGW